MILTSVLYCFNINSLFMVEKNTIIAASNPPHCETLKVPQFCVEKFPTNI